MQERDIITMSQKELKRLHIIHKVLDKSVRQFEAAEIIRLSPRQIRRITERVRKEGDQGIAHKLRARPSNRSIPSKTKDRVIKLFKEKYPDFGPTLASEKLFEIDKIKINDETLRLWLIRENIPYRRRRKRPHRQWRERKHHFGEMVQKDGSKHDWFEGRGPKCVFDGYIDDATGTAFGKFCTHEGTHPAMDSFRCYVRKYGIPMSVYLDKHTTYKSNAKPSVEDELEGKEHLSQFERALKELGVGVIHANSPQAKGRIERLFNTFQDRLIKEMRLRKIKTIEEANKFLKYYLPIYNRRFSIRPLEDTNLHRPVPKGVNLDKILCVKQERALRNDFTVAYNNKLYQIKDNIKANKVTIEERLNGSMAIIYKGRTLRFKQVALRSKRQKEPKPYVFAVRKLYIAPKEHPWKKFRTIPHINSYQQREKGSQKEKELLLVNS